MLTSLHVTIYLRILIGSLYTERLWLTCWRVQSASVIIFKLWLLWHFLMHHSVASAIRLSIYPFVVPYG